MDSKKFEYSHVAPPTRCVGISDTSNYSLARSLFTKIPIFHLLYSSICRFAEIRMNRTRLVGISVVRTQCPTRCSFKLSRKYSNAVSISKDAFFDGLYLCLNSSQDRYTLKKKITYEEQHALSRSDIIPDFPSYSTSLRYPSLPNIHLSLPPRSTPIQA